MDDPDIIPNSTGVVVDQNSTMTSVSPPERTMVLGVVNTAGMKSTNLNRKRRWDQPPEELSEMPCVKKVLLCESPAPICDNPSLDRLSERSSDLEQCEVLNSNESKSYSGHLSHSGQLPCEGNAMSIDLPPEDLCDRLPKPSEVISTDAIMCGETNECLSTIQTSECSASDEKVNSCSSELRLKDSNLHEEIDSSKALVSEKPKLVKEDKAITVVSHQSDELRRIMFSYDDGSSDSDTSDSNTAKVDSSDNNNVDKLVDSAESNSQPVSDECITSKHVPALPTCNEADAVSLNKDKLNYTNISLPSDGSENVPSLLDKEETDAFIGVNALDSVNSRLNNEIEDESQRNIPNQNLDGLITTEIKDEDVHLPSKSHKVDNDAAKPRLENTEHEIQSQSLDSASVVAEDKDEQEFAGNHRAEEQNNQNSLKLNVSDKTSVDDENTNNVTSTSFESCSEDGSLKHNSKKKEENNSNKPLGVVENQTNLLESTVPSICKSNFLSEPKERLTNDSPVLNNIENKCDEINEISFPLENEKMEVENCSEVLLNHDECKEGLSTLDEDFSSEASKEESLEGKHTKNISVIESPVEIANEMTENLSSPQTVGEVHEDSKSVLIDEKCVSSNFSRSESPSDKLVLENLQQISSVENVNEISQDDNQSMDSKKDSEVDEERSEPAVETTNSGLEVTDERSSDLPSNSIDPVVMQVIFGSTNDVLKSNDSEKEDEVSTSDSDSNTQLSNNLCLENQDDSNLDSFKSSSQATEIEKLNAADSLDSSGNRIDNQNINTECFQESSSNVQDKNDDNHMEVCSTTDQGAMELSEMSEEKDEEESIAISKVNNEKSLAESDNSKETVDSASSIAELHKKISTSEDNFDINNDVLPSSQLVNKEEVEELDKGPLPDSTLDVDKLKMDVEEEVKSEENSPLVVQEPPEDIIEEQSEKHTDIIEKRIEEPSGQNEKESAEENILESQDKTVEEHSVLMSQEPQNVVIEKSFEGSSKESGDQNIEETQKETIKVHKEEIIIEPPERTSKESSEQLTEEQLNEIKDDAGSPSLKGSPEHNTVDLLEARIKDSSERLIEETETSGIEESSDKAIGGPHQMIIEDPIEEFTEEPQTEMIKEPLEETIKKELEEPLEATTNDPLENRIEVPQEGKIDALLKEKIEVPLEEKIDVPLEETIKVPLEETIKVPQEETIEVPLEEKVDGPQGDIVDDPMGRLAESSEKNNKESQDELIGMPKDGAVKESSDQIIEGALEITNVPSEEIVEKPLDEAIVKETEEIDPKIKENVFPLKTDISKKESSLEEKCDVINEDDEEQQSKLNKQQESSSKENPTKSSPDELIDIPRDESVEVAESVVLLSEEANLDPVETSILPEEGESKLKLLPEEPIPEISLNPLVNDSDDTGKALTEEIESFDVVEEVVTCESPQSDKASDNEIEGVINEDDNAQFGSDEMIEASQASSDNSDQLEPVIDNDTSDLKVSDNDNQKTILIDAEVCLKPANSSSILDKGISGKSNVLGKELLLNSIKSEFSLENSQSKNPVNSIIKSKTPFVDEDMEVDEPPEVASKIPVTNNPGESSFSAVINSVKSESKVLKEIVSSDVPLLKTVSSPARNFEVCSMSKEHNEGNLMKDSLDGHKREPITLKLYKDNLTVKTDDLDSPRRIKSPKSQHSPLVKISESRGSLSPQNKQLEFTIKIAKDVNTKIPKATMSPKSNMSPNSSWKLESASNSPGSPGESNQNPLKRKLSKDIDKSEDHIDDALLTQEEDMEVDGSPCLPKPTIEISSALKKMMEADKMEHKPESSILEQVLSGATSEVAKKRGRPRKILSTTEGEENSPVNHSPTPPEESALDTSGEGSEQGASRQVRSCRARTAPIIAKPRKPRGGGAAGAAARGGGRGGARGVARPIASVEEAEKIQEKLSEYEKAELAKIEARKEKLRQDRIAKNEAKKAKKLAKKLKDEERRKRLAAEKAEKAAAAAPQVFEEETRMSAPDSRGHTPAPVGTPRPNLTSETMEESQSSITGTPVSSKTGNHKGRMEIPIDPESDEVRVDQLAEYQWQGSDLFMIQEQVSLYLGVKSFKRKYPDLKRRPVEAEERTFLEDSGLVPKSMCDLGLTAVSSAEILDIMYHDFPDKYEEFRKHCREKQAREMSFKQRALAVQQQSAKAKGELRELALEAAAVWNSNLNKERREERRCSLDLQTFTVHYPKTSRERMIRPALRPGLYPVPVIPGQFSDYYKTYTPTELMYFPLNTVMYGPLKPNERRLHSDGSDTSSSSSDDSSSSSCDSDSEDEESVSSKECKICNGEKKSNNESHPEILLQCSQCKGLCHPTCQEITPEMLPHIKRYSWHCSNCKKCMQCKSTTKEDKMLFCDLCDRGYHLTCVGLKKSPEGRWHCSVCSFCTICGSKDPGGEWHYEYKKTDKGVRLYQRTLCAPCGKNALM